MKKQYSALMMDLVNSKKYKNDERLELQNKIGLVLDELNRLFHRSIHKYVYFSAGDEVQGLFDSPQAAYHYYRLFSMLLYPVKLRAGIGVGTWDIQLADKGTTGQDGTAYHHARIAIEKADETEGVLLYSGYSIDYIINSTINAATLLCQNQTGRQNEYYLLAEVISPLAEDQIINMSALPLTLVKLFPLTEEHEENLFPLYADRIFSQSLLNEQPIVKPHRQIQTNSTETFFITSGKQWGLSTAISGITGVSRQNVDNIIKAGNIYTIRNLSIAAAKAMEQFCTEEDDS